MATRGQEDTGRLVVVGPEQPLTEGLVEALNEEGFLALVPIRFARNRSQ